MHKLFPLCTAGCPCTSSLYFSGVVSASSAPLQAEGHHHSLRGSFRNGPETSCSIWLPAARRRRVTFSEKKCIILERTAVWRHFNLNHFSLWCQLFRRRWRWGYVHDLTGGYCWCCGHYIWSKGTKALHELLLW